MTSPEFAPAPGAAPLPVMVAAQARMETKLILRNGEQLLIAIVIPLIVLIAGVPRSTTSTTAFPTPRSTR